MSLSDRQLGRYRVLDVLGSGATSVVYRASDPQLSRDVAIKVLHPHLSGNAELRARLEQEARAVARLRHPNILEVYDGGVLPDAEGAYLVTELVTGRTLRELIDGALRPPELAACLLLVIARALAHAHAAGVIHRDLKPENVMLRKDGVLKIMDFGVARLLDGSGVDRLTATGALVGSPAHMAPEIVEGHPARFESDVFSLGTVLFLWLTGTLPFTGPNAAATLHRVLTAAPEDPRRLRPELSDELAALVLRCLDRRPDRRYANAEALADALAAHLAELDVVDAAAEVTRAFASEPPDGAALEARVVDAQLRRAEEALAKGRSAKALAWIDGVLRRAPAEPRALALYERASGPTPKHRAAPRLVRWALLAGALFVGALGGLRGFREATPRTEVTERSSPAPPPPPPEALPVEAPAAAHDAPVAATAPAPAPAPAPPPSVPSTPPQVPAARAAPPRRVGVSPTPAPAPPTGLVALEVHVRPWGAVAVDDGPGSSDELALHRLRLPPGRHRFRVTCRDFCSMNGSVREVEVLEGMEPLLLVAPLRPALVRFEGYPPGATVSLGGTERDAAETSTKPLEVSAPSEGVREMRLRLVYEVRHRGERIEAGERWLAPGASLTIAAGGS